MPLKTYSSGMMMRLAFSVATIVEPEILIVDEILAVGDEAFQKKSRVKMLELMGGGTTVLYVSHSIAQIRELCNRVIWLDGGKIVIFGGGIPLKVDGRIIGGLGISGGTGEEDHSLAEYGLSVLPEIL